MSHDTSPEYTRPFSLPVTESEMQSIRELGATLGVSPTAALRALVRASLQAHSACPEGLKLYLPPKSRRRATSGNWGW